VRAFLGELDEATEVLALAAPGRVEFEVAAGLALLDFEELVLFGCALFGGPDVPLSPDPFCAETTPPKRGVDG